MGFRDFINSVKKEFVTPPKAETPPITNCPNCGAPLEKNAVQGTAVCPYCGTQLNENKLGVVNTVVAFIERQQTRMVSEKERKRKEKELARQKREERFRKTWWIPLVVLAVIGLVVVVILKLV